MIKLLLHVLLLSIGTTGLAQKDSVRKYLDADLKFTSKKNFVYAAMAVRSDDHWILYAVYPDTSMLLKIYFKDAALTIKDGPYELYHRQKIPAQKGYYKNNMANGRWQSWYANGRLKNEGTITSNHLSGLWKYWYENGQPMSEESYVYSNSAEGGPAHESPPSYKVERLMDETAPAGKLEGPAATWYKNGNKESVINYHNDSLLGVCTWFWENGQPSSRETYTDGKVTALECYDSTGKYTGATCSILKLPQLIHPFFDAVDYIEYELHKEKHKKIAEGDAKISFIVTKQGAVEKLAFLDSPDQDLNKLIVQIFSKMPAWSPAVAHNRAVDYPVQLEIPWYRD